VGSIYDYNYCSKVWREFSAIELDKKKESNMIFTMPNTAVKCAGAPQKIMWLLEDYLERQGLNKLVNIEFIVPGPSMFGIKYYAEKLDKIRVERGITGMFRHELVSLDVDKKEATFKNLDKGGELVKKSYDLIHVCPNMSAPDCIQKSKLANQAGWVDVDKHTMQSTKYSNVFALGDCASTPNSKTAAAITSQAPVLVHNLGKEMEKSQLNGSYNGYASCPLILGRNKVMLAEFGYDGKLMETFNRETGKFPYNLLGTEGAIPERAFYFLKEQFFPFVYWNLWTYGRWYGTNGPFKPDVVKKEDKKNASA
jgi:NADPH-dependent 2,4-dienoyl-CoA reductase/sulfur reductase-like enzyme